ncbi:MAG: ATP-dependent DNA helicase [Deltaproteobacteria bacterium]|nr:ATP-dependent DNA helicase [Deltaproteobacteria bacterium]
MKQTLQIAVRTLVEHVLRSGDLELTFLGASRAIEGIRAHQQIQKSRPDTYVPEVHVSHSVDTGRFVLIVSGRIDGVYHEPHRVMIDEIKTTLSDLNTLNEKEDSLHWAQAKCYAYLYGLSHSLSKIDIQLTYYRLDTGQIREFHQSHSMQSLETFFKELIDRYLQWAESIIDWYGVRSSSIRLLNFPFGSYRPGQREMAADVYRTIKQKNQLLIQAPTGIGKTMAVIYPAVKAIGKGLTPKVFYLTARTTGKIIAEKMFEEIRKQGGRIKSLTITAKEKICFRPESSCSAEECEYAKGHFDRINGAIKESFNEDALTRETIVEKAQSHRVCPFELTLELSNWADCIICDYNYAFDPRAFLRRFFMEEGNGYVFLIDEAHNLVDRARDMFSSEICKQPFLSLRRVIKEELPAIYKALGAINSLLVKKRKQCEAAAGMMAEKDPPEALFPLLRRFLWLTERWLSLNIKTQYLEDLMDLYFSVSAFIKIWEQYDDSYATCTEVTGDDLKVKLFCVDPSVSLRNALSRCGAAVFFSATLTPLDYFQSLLGCEDMAEKRVLPSPFPEENLCVLISDHISTRYRHRKSTVTEVAETLIHLVEQKQGNYLLFFPSYEYMRMVHATFVNARPQLRTLLQAPEMCEEERERFLEQFVKETSNTLIGFVVMGGVFSEGIDLAGERLSGAAVVGPGLPGISLERQLIRDYFDHHLGQGFEYAYLFPGMTRVLQAAGRVIRSESDRGVILLIGQRFKTPTYRNLLPQQWQPISVRSEDQLNEILKRFW